MNYGDILVLLVLGVIVGCIIYRMIKPGKKGCSCSGCVGCSSSGCCGLECKK